MRSLWRALALGAGLIALPLSGAHATPVVDGILDAEYGAPLATSPKDNLIVDEAAGINDPANPKAKVIDATNIYVSNSGNSLYIFVRLPYYSLQTAHGDWSVALHLGGANNDFQVSNTTTDPYGIQVFYNYPNGRNPNAVIKANFVSTGNFSDGVNGWGYLNIINETSNGWRFPGTDYFGSAAAGRPGATATTFKSIGASGSEIAYVNGDGTGNTGGIEMKVPLADFTREAVLTAPVVGNTIHLQWYASFRADDNSHPRAAIDLVPFEESGRAVADSTTGARNYTQGILTQQVAYTLKSATTPFDVLAAYFVNPTTIGVRFSDNVGTGGTTTANYVVTNVDTGQNVPVTAAAVVAGANNQVALTVGAITSGARYRVTVNNVQSAGSVVVTPANNTGEFVGPVQVIFELCDNGNIVPEGQPVTVTGNFIEWSTAEDREVVLTKDATGTCYHSQPVFITPMEIEYKYRLNRTDWDILNRRNRRAVIAPPGPITVQDAIGGTVQTTFNLIDFENRINGRTAFLFNFNPDPAQRIPLTPVAGQPNTYTTGPTPFIQNTYEYKYVIVGTDEFGAETLDYDALNAFNRYVEILGAGTPPAQVVNDTAGVRPVTPAERAARALRIAGGLEAAPSGTDFDALDVMDDNKITIADAVRLLR